MNNATSLSWSNVDYSLHDFIKNFSLPQVVKLKKDATKHPALKSNSELLLHECRTVIKVQACVVSENKQFVIPYDYPAKVYQLSKAEQYSSLEELRKSLPTCRYCLVTSKSKEGQLKDLKPGELLTIVFKKTDRDGDVFTCQRKKGGEINIPASAVGGFAPMATTQERKINEFVRHYSTFPIGIGLSESTLPNKALGSLNELVSTAQSGLIRLTKLYDEHVVIASSLGRKKSMFSIPKLHQLTVTAPKPLLYESTEHAELCKQLHSTVDITLIERHLNLAISTSTGGEVLQWSYDDESTYEDVVPLQKGVGDSGEPKRDDKNQTSRTTTKTKDNNKDERNQKSKEKVKEKPKEKVKEDKTKEKSKEKVKEKKSKEAKQKSSDEKPKEEKPKEVKPRDEKPKDKKEQAAADLVEDDSGYLIPSELLEAEKKRITSAEGGYEAVEPSEKSSKAKASTFGRLMGKVKGKDKKKDRPSSEVITVDTVEANAKSETLPAAGNNSKKSGFWKNKAKTLSAVEVGIKHNEDEADGSPGPTDKGEARKRDKSIFGTAGKKAGAKLRHKLARSKVIDDQLGGPPKPDSPEENSSPSPSDEDFVQDMYVTPVDDQLSQFPSNSAPDRPLPELPPQEFSRQTSDKSIPYDAEEDLYDEINPVTQTKKFKIPKDLSKLTVDDVSEVLRYLNMNEHVAKFKNDLIDGEIFKSLDEKTLGALGVADPIQRLKLKKLIKGWRPKN